MCEDNTCGLYTGKENGYVGGRRANKKHAGLQTEVVMRCECPAQQTFCSFYHDITCMIDYRTRPMGRGRAEGGFLPQGRLGYVPQ